MFIVLLVATNAFNDYLTTVLDQLFYFLDESIFSARLLGL